MINSQNALTKANQYFANQGKSQQELYEEAQAKVAAAAADAAKRKADAEKLKNLQKEMQ
jgi:hypothetical protein